MEDKIKLKSENWNIKTEERSRGRMKLIIKLNKEETEGFTNWKNTVKPDDMNEEVFLRQIFFRGMEALNTMLESAAKEIMNDENLKQQLQSSGIDLTHLEAKLEEK